MKHIDFCTHCREETEYCLYKTEEKEMMKDKEYTFIITSAKCKKCHKDIFIPGLIDLNNKEIDEQYRSLEGIVSIEDIEKLMRIYKIGKAPLSLALGFGEITITRYLLGQIPSKEYSDIIYFALTSPSYMKEKLVENKDKIAKSAYQKSIKAIVELEEIFTISKEMLGTISYIFELMDEVTPLMLQKLLYYVQGLSFVEKDEPMFTEDCQAWIHGPVYPEVYQLFKDFKYNPIEDDRFILLKGCEKTLSEKDQEIIELVVTSFMEYNGKVLERITHKEDPWINARNGYGEDVPSNEWITKNDIQSYFIKMDKKYHFTAGNGLRNYINNMLKR